jgi:hypothetical protein
VSAHKRRRDTGADALLGAVPPTRAGEAFPHVEAGELLRAGRTTGVAVGVVRR